MAATFAQTVVSTTGSATSCEVAGETVILDAASGQYFALDPIGTAIWEHLKTPSTVEALCAKLCGEYDVSPERCEADVTALLKQLAGHGLIRMEP